MTGVGGVDGGGADPGVDGVGTDPGPVGAAADLAETLLWPNALRTESSGVLPAGLRPALARAGLFGLAAPGGADPATFRAVQEHLAGGCLASAFVWTQHHTPLRLVAASPNPLVRERWLAPLRDGEALAAVAFSQLRRPDGGVRAEPVGRGEGGNGATGGRRGGGGGGCYVLNGIAPWVTSWTLADVLLVGALAPPTRSIPTARVIWGAVDLSAISEPAREPGVPRPPGLPGIVGSPLPLAVLGATRTVALRFEGFRLDEADVVHEESREDFETRDRLATASPNPLALGLATRATRLLAERHPDAAATLAGAVDECRSVGEALLGETAALPGGSAPQAELLAALRASRVRGLLLASQAATALVAASGGRAIATTDPAQLLHRHAAFLLVQAQTATTREATLAALVGSGTGSAG